jgi:hypothetical protein
MKPRILAASGLPAACFVAKGAATRQFPAGVADHRNDRAALLFASTEKISPEPAASPSS